MKKDALNYQEHRYGMSIILDSIRTMISTKQKEHESLSDYIKRFKVAKDVMKSHIGGPIILSKYVEQIDDYDVTSQTKVNIYVEEAHDLMLRLLYLENVGQRKYVLNLKRT